jgi:hypothetical protein
MSAREMNVPDDSATLVQAGGPRGGGGPRGRAQVVRGARLPAVVPAHRPACLGDGRAVILPRPTPYYPVTYTGS